MRSALIVLLCLAVCAASRAETAVAPPETYGDAVRWYEKAASAGYANAQYLLGYMYQTGNGRDRDAAAAARWYRRAAAQGHPLAQFRLGWLRQNGIGIESDAAKAASWYVSAAAQGVAEAAFNLGYLYETGDGVAPDPEKAGTYYRQAAAKGLAGAQMNLGLLLAAQKEDGTAKRESFLWLSLAADQGVTDAQAARDAVAATLSSEEVEAVRRRIEAGKATR